LEVVCNRKYCDSYLVLFLRWIPSQLGRVVLSVRRRLIGTRSRQSKRRGC
jgi:hypothetical protein